jgi:hypothetical protein
MVSLAALPSIADLCYQAMTTLFGRVLKILNKWLKFLDKKPLINPL